MNGIEYVAKILKSEGIAAMTCFPSNPIIEAAAKEGIRVVTFRHERGAVMAADGISRTSARQQFGVVAVQSQAGAENSMGGLAQAYADNIPVLVLPGGIPISQMGVRPNFSAVHKYQGWVKQIEAIYAPEEVGNVMRRAFHALRSGPPGPVIVELTADVCNREVPTESQNYKPPRPALQTPAPSDIRDAVRKLLAARKPVIRAGGGVLLSGATTELEELVELTGIPVFCSMPGKSAFDERHPLSLGAGSRASTLAGHQWQKDCDALLALGTSLTRTPYAYPIHPGKFLIQNSINPEDINKDESVDIGLVGDTRLTILTLIEEFKAQGTVADSAKISRVRSEIQTMKEKWLEQWIPLLTSEETPLNYYRVIHEINQTLDWENSIVTHDAGAPRDSMMPFYTATTANSYVGWGKTTHLGFGIPLMIGAKLAHPDKFCLNLMGDGAFGMSGLDLETAVRTQLPITTVLLNNGAMATYAGSNAMAIAQERYGVTYMQGDYARIAEGMGAVGIRVSQPSEMAPALKEAQRLNKEGQTVLIDVRANVEGRRSIF